MQQAQLRSFFYAALPHTIGSFVDMLLVIWIVIMQAGLWAFRELGECLLLGDEETCHPESPYCTSLANAKQYERDAKPSRSSVKSCSLVFWL